MSKVTLTLSFGSTEELKAYLDSQRTAPAPATPAARTLEETKKLVLSVSANGKKSELRAIFDRFGIAKCGDCPTDQIDALYAAVENA